MPRSTKAAPATQQTTDRAGRATLEALHETYAPPPKLPLGEWLAQVDVFAERLRAKYGTFSHEQLTQDIAEMREERMNR